MVELPYSHYKEKTMSRQALGMWLDKLEWNYWFTGTFKRDFRKDSAIKAFYRWLNTMTWINCVESYGHAWFLEWHKYREVPHIHALLYLPGVKSERLASWWKVWFKHYGRARIEKYDSNLGTGFYLTKYMVKDSFGRGGWFVDYPKT